ncbi:hypothetical protein [Paraburkholderia elongata]|nr:hypothetical protein [Paraburkholderia elongata]
MEIDILGIDLAKQVFQLHRAEGREMSLPADALHRSRLDTAKGVP